MMSEWLTDSIYSTAINVTVAKTVKIASTAITVSTTRLSYSNTIPFIPIIPMFPLFQLYCLLCYLLKASSGSHIYSYHQSTEFWWWSIWTRKWTSQTTMLYPSITTLLKTLTNDTVKLPCSHPINQFRQIAPPNNIAKDLFKWNSETCPFIHMFIYIGKDYAQTYTLWTTMPCARTPAKPNQ